MSQQGLFWVLLIVYLLIELTGTLLLKQWVVGGETKNLLIGLGMYFTCSCVWAVQLRSAQLAKAGIIYTLVAMISSVLLGTLYYKEKLTNTNILGVLLGCAAVIMVCSGPSDSNTSVG